MAIQVEKNGEKICRQAAKSKLDPPLAGLLAWMATEEQRHIKWFEELWAAADSAGDDFQLEKMNRDFLTAILGRQTFSLGDADFGRIKKVASLLSLLIEFENDTILFYEMIRSAVNDPQTLKVLKTIIAEEKNHVKHLQAFAGSRVERKLPRA